MLKTIALDCDLAALNVVEDLCRGSGFIDLRKTFTSADDALDYLSKFPVDLLFLAIDMPAVSGIDFRKHTNAMMILTASDKDFAIEGFNLNAVDYLLKPFTAERFLRAVEKARSYHLFLQQQLKLKPDHIMIRVNYVLTKVMLADILFIEGLDDYLKIHLRGQRNIITRMTMKLMLEKLPQADFMRVHRSYIVPLARIEAVRNKNIVINGSSLPIGVSYAKRFFEAFGG